MNPFQRFELEIFIFNTPDLYKVLPKLYRTSKTIGADINAILRINPTKAFQEVPYFGKHGIEFTEMRQTQMLNDTRGYMWYLGVKLWKYHGEHYHAHAWYNSELYKERVPPYACLSHSPEGRHLFIGDLWLEMSGDDGGYYRFGVSNNDDIRHYNSAVDLLYDYPQFRQYLSFCGINDTDAFNNDRSNAVRNKFKGI